MSSEINHWAIDGSGLSMKSDFIQDLLKGEGMKPFEKLKGKRGALFSNLSLKRFIREEAIHDNFSLSEKEHRSILTFSSGEQRKALLDYLLSKNPDFLVLENAFDMLDKVSQEKLVEKLENLSERMPIIQVFHRKDNILPFIKQVLRAQGDQLVFVGSQDEYRKQFGKQSGFLLEGKIPPALGGLKQEGNPLVQFNRVSVCYGERKILNDICWEIKQGDFWQLKGPNGSGKTTLLTMITGDNPKAFGQDLVLFGKKKGTGESVWEIKKKIGYVTPAMTTLFGGRHSVESMVVSGFHDSIGLYEKPTVLEQKLADQWIDLIGLGDYKHRWFSDLSEGQQCMVLIARSMVKHPPLLILDEPTHGLDDYSVSILTTLVNKIAEESQTTIIYVSHKDEPGLTPSLIYELVPAENGSNGIVSKRDIN